MTSLPLHSTASISVSHLVRIHFLYSVSRTHASSLFPLTDPHLLFFYSLPPLSEALRISLLSLRFDYAYFSRGSTSLHADMNISFSLVCASSRFFICSEYSGWTNSWFFYNVFRRFALLEARAIRVNLLEQTITTKTFNIYNTKTEKGKTRVNFWMNLLLASL